MGLRYRFAQFSRLLNRSPRDIVRFSLYFTKSAPTFLLDRISYSLFGPRKHKLNPLSPSIIGGNWRILTDDPRISAEGGSIVQSGELEILGRRLSIGWPPRWETEETGQWPKGLSSSIAYFGNDVCTDIKIVWELHRLQWLPCVAAMAAERNDRALASQVLDVICDYIGTHPRNTTVAWMEGIEVSLRAISIIECCSHIGDLIGEDDRFRLIQSSLGDHSEWISKHLSDKWRLNNNHILIELIGLLILSERLDWHPKSEYWNSLASKKLSTELLSQVSSGRNWEPTTAYHRFVTEAILVAIKHIESGNPNSPIIKGLKENANNMVRTLELMTDHSGFMPLIGDDDAGMVLPRIPDFDARDNSRVISFSKEVGIVAGEIEDGTYYWEEQGMGVIRTRKFVLNFVSGAPTGVRRQGSHRHLDMLSLSLSIDGEESVLDGGTGLYFGDDEMRNLFRSEISHSGIFSRISKWANFGGLFEIRKPPIGVFEIIDSGVRISCQHPSGGRPKREITIGQKGVLVRDHLDLEEPSISFLVPTGGETSVSEGVFSIKFPTWELSHSPSPIDYSLSDYDRSTGYGVFEQVTRIELQHHRDSVAETRFTSLENA